MSMQIDVVGDAQIKALLAQTGHKLHRAVKDAVAEATLELEGRAKKLAPVDTGRLRSSIGHELDADGLGGTVTANVEYAEHVEYGTTTQEAQPYMTPAYHQISDRFNSIVADHARKVTG